MSVQKASGSRHLRRLFLAASAAALFVSVSSVAAKADYDGDGWRGPPHDWQEQRWRDHERREREREWRRHEWAAAHNYGYYAPPAYTYYQQPRYYQQPGYYQSYPNYYGYAQPQAQLSIGIPLD